MDPFSHGIPDVFSAQIITPHAFISELDITGMLGSLFLQSFLRSNLTSRHAFFYVSRNYLARSLQGAMHAIYANNKRKIQIGKEMR